MLKTSAGVHSPYCIEYQLNLCDTGRGKSDMVCEKMTLVYVKKVLQSISPFPPPPPPQFHHAFQFTICNGPTNALVCNKILNPMSHIKTLKITPTCFDHQLFIIRELFDPR
jgi:hypothetical protein